MKRFFLLMFMYPILLLANCDVHFLDKMSEHYRLSIQLSEFLLGHSKNMEIKKITRIMIRRDRKKMNQILLWREKYFSSVYRDYFEEIKYVIDSEVNFGVDFDKKYIKKLVEHYQTGFSLLRDEGVKSELEFIVEFAKKEIKEKKKEIDELEGLRKKLELTGD